MRRLRRRRISHGEVLRRLRRSELIESDTGWFLGEPALKFHHGLIRDAAYRRVLKGTRAELHGRFADWLESRVGESVEHDETMGWHLEQAHQQLRELGPIDAHSRAIGERAARYLAAAGRRALERDDLPLAASLLGRALDQLDPTDPARADLALDWCEALLTAGDVGPAAAAVAELARFTGGSERLQAWHTCFAGQLAALTEPATLRATADAVTTAAAALVSLGDAAGEAKAHFVHATVLARLGEVGACEAALDRALAAARRAGDRRRANAVLAGAPIAALWGPSPVTRASGRCLDVVRVLRITQGAPAVEAVALRCQAVLEALRGRAEAARRLYGSSGLVGAELFELEDLEVARARFEELRPDPLRIPPNAAIRISARMSEAPPVRDWAALRALASDDFVYEDRGKRALLRGDVEMWIASLKFVYSVPGFRAEIETIGTVGDRLALERMVWTGAPDGDTFELERIRLLEVDGAGRLRTSILFDADDRSAAFAEALDRFVAGEAAATGGQAPYAAFVRAFVRHDWDAAHQALAPDLVFDDHRRLGLGTLDRDQWVASIRAQADLAPDLAAEVSPVLAWNRHGLAAMIRTFGTVPDGGPFENVFVAVALTDGDCIQRHEVFDVTDAERALARFAELSGEERR